MENCETSELKGDDREELRLLYSSSANEIAFFKQQQWIVTNYAVAIQASVFAIGHLIGADLQNWERWLLVLIVGATAISGLFILFLLHASIGVRRTRLRRVRASFGKPFRCAWHVPKQRDCVSFFLVFSQLVAAALASWLVICHI